MTGFLLLDYLNNREAKTKAGFSACATLAVGMKSKQEEART